MYLGGSSSFLAHAQEDEILPDDVIDEAEVEDEGDATVETDEGVPEAGPDAPPTDVTGVC